MGGTVEMNALWLLVDIAAVMAAGWQAERHYRAPRRAERRPPRHTPTVAERAPAARKSA